MSESKSERANDEALAPSKTLGQSTQESPSIVLHYEQEMPQQSTVIGAFVSKTQLDTTSRWVEDMTPTAAAAYAEIARLTYALPAAEKTKQVAEETRRAVKQAEEETKRAKEETLRAQEETKRALEQTKQEKVGAVRYGIAGATTLVLGCITAYKPEAGAALASMVVALCGTQVFVTYFNKKKAKPENDPPSSK